MADNKGTYMIVQSCPSVQSYAGTGGRGFNLETVKWMLTNMKPEYVATVGDSYFAAADALATATNRLHQHAQRLVDVWSGKDAELALGRLRQLNVTAAGLQEASFKTARTYSWLGNEILPWYRDEGTRMGAGAFRDSGDDQAALEMLDRMDNRILQGYNNMPPSIEKDLPPPAIGSGFQGSKHHGSTTPPGRIGPPSGVPYDSPPGISDPTGQTPPTDPSSPIPTGPYDPRLGGDLPSGSDPGGGLPSSGGTDLAGIGGGPPGAGGIGGGPGGLGGGAGGLGGAPSGLGGGTGGLGGALGAGAPGGIGAGRGGAGSKSAAGRSGAGRSGMNAPMGGGAGHGSGEGEEERERTTWLTEDDDVWSDDGDIAPPVIG